ncbi:sulfocyanin-like copper-binding protein [Streptomyces sp. NPDC059649]|uniref:sulfocyanin-like copper-binding protein n=1 Tax=Streptomyces sp. NPDC059649 TaxID=3346895 RepID=UPI0036984AD6
MTTNRPRGLWLAVGAVAALVLGIGTTLLIAATGGLHGGGPAPWRGAAVRCGAPPLKGHAVDVTVGDMGPGMRHRPDGRVPNSGPGRHGLGMMWLRVTPRAVPAGVVSLRVVNVGALPHEVVVLPLPTGQPVGERPTGADGRVDEAGSVGEASRSCGAGSGGGIAPGATAWTTVTLHPGRYELVCNLPGHYGAGMYAELDVTR